ncbi:cytochrome P450 307a1 [Anopheles ziemanni]|uniref:cytochrome P450 307a1 n=1 Tax=Anopheles coustani TaxID=139045 RepID=UPI002658D5D6|nr:cytochrome P450 307a1 [Anopheles coustani]XP_058175748.1 cytochrome P450 307a1 [Anopheles ziemanni]
MAYTGLILAVLTIILSVVCYFKILYEWHRKVRLQTVRPGRLQKLAQVVQQQQHQQKQQSTTNATTTELVTFPQAPGPIPWPILGSLAFLGQYEVPFEGFTALAKKYGDLYSITLGSTRCLVVNNLDLIREVLNQNGRYFGGRPDFLRFHKLFGGDRNNSLALCDWSALQQKRRNLARKHCSPSDASSYYQKMSDVGVMEMHRFMDQLDEVVSPGSDFKVKPLIMQACANMFSQYMCSVRFDYNDQGFVDMVRNFDEIFWEINQGYAVDFLPWLAPFYHKHMSKLTRWSAEIRDFILERIVNEREQTLGDEDTERDFTDALLKSLREDPSVTRDTIMYMLEDFLGGHSAIGNLVMLALGYIAKNPAVGQHIQSEIDRITERGQRNVTLYDTESMPYTVATIFEVLRYSSSPIVPHVATEDTCIAGYGVTKGTVVFINNYELNTSEKYWDEPKRFNPSRFIETATLAQIRTDLGDSPTARQDLCSIIKTNRISSENERTMQIERVRKNIPHFLPFSIGKRTCIGQNLVRGFSFIIIANILQKYNVYSNDTTQIKMYPACVAVPPDTYSLAFTHRTAGETR